MGNEQGNMTSPPPFAGDGSIEIGCKNCGATIVVVPELRTAECPYCASPAVVERPPAPDRPEPTFVLGFVIEQERAQESVKQWLKTRGLFAHGGLKQAAIGKTRGLYLPSYLYGGVAEASYSARIGENYTETETYTTTDAKGNTVTRTRTVTKTEWRSLSGTWENYIVDVVVTASKGVRNEELDAIEPFDLRALRRYTPAVLSGWIAEEPSMGRGECIRLAHGETEARIGRELAAFMPGDSHSDLRYEVHLHDERADLVMLPVWVFAARYAEDKPPVRILVNGQTGLVAGEVPKSVPKIVAAVILGVVIVGLIVLLIAGAVAL